ncbi:MAG: zinc ribbon domain-containing protein [Thermodesulfovibrionales bacterium]|nr:zinc ribbon domain-containing protein [Thermodesulfovibrionales bacterium]
MPIYEYLCNRCKAEFMMLQKMGTSERDTECPKCGSKDVKKKLSSFSCSFSGGYGLSSSGGFSGGT